MTDVTQTVFHDHAEEISQELRRSESGAHFLIVYPDLQTLREMYSHYTKSALFDGDEIVVILPFYETADNVRRVLSENGANIDVRKYQKEQSLLVMDSLKGYFGKEGIMPFVKQTVKFAKNSGKSSVSVLSDMGSFFYYNKKDNLMDWEMKLPHRFEGNLKGFCLYHRQDFDARFSESDQHILLKHHCKAFDLLPF
ncbi:MAG TPA: MEDS domain-containing protein [Nitrososphaeraceae archaeon]|nr:MEDS domain-containing protein [Nitrososphaeraceae archaeon]